MASANCCKTASVRDHRLVGQPPGAIEPLPQPYDLGPLLHRVECRVECRVEGRALTLGDGQKRRVGADVDGGDAHQRLSVGDHCGASALPR